MQRLSIPSDRVLQFPYRGAPQTVAVIQDAALSSERHYGVRQLAEAASRHIPSKDYLSEALALGNLVEQRTRYMRDPRTVELVRAPYIIVEEIFAGHKPSLDCDDMTALICALLLSAGHQCRIVTVAFRHQFFQKKRQYSHVFAQAREPRTGAWITLDPVAGAGTKSMLGRVVAAKIWPVA